MEITRSYELRMSTEELDIVRVALQTVDPYRVTEFELDDAHEMAQQLIAELGG